eukprot:3935167-Rhodomonas_salina.4
MSAVSTTVLYYSEHCSTTSPSTAVLLLLALTTGSRGTTTRHALLVGAVPVDFGTVQGQHYQARGVHGCVDTPRNQIQETTILVQIVLKLRFLAIDFALYHQACQGQSRCHGASSVSAALRHAAARLHNGSIAPINRSTASIDSSIALVVHSFAQGQLELEDHQALAVHRGVPVGHRARKCGMSAQYCLRLQEHCLHK